MTPSLTPVRYQALCGAVAESVHGLSPRILTAVAMTPCCQAAATDYADSETGVACKACYRPVSARYRSSGWEALHQAARDARCPVPADCADFMLDKVLGS